MNINLTDFQRYSIGMLVAESIVDQDYKITDKERVFFGLIALETLNQLTRENMVTADTQAEADRIDDESKSRVIAGLRELFPTEAQRVWG